MKERMEKPNELMRTLFYDKFGISYNKKCFLCYEDGEICLTCRICNYLISFLMVLVALSFLKEGQKLKIKTD